MYDNQSLRGDNEKYQNAKMVDNVKLVRRIDHILVQNAHLFCYKTDAGKVFYPPSEQPRRSELVN